MSTHFISLNHRFNTKDPIGKNLAQNLSEYVTHLVEKGGPDPTDYPRLSATMELFSQKAITQHFDQQDWVQIRNSFGEAMTIQTIQGWAYHKPFGYAGDFKIIDNIYTYAEAAQPHLAKWDRYFHSQKAPQAVRNRQSYFLEQIWQTSDTRPSGASILNLASGPGRDLHEAMKVIGPTRVQIDCVEQDVRAIDYAKHLCQDFLSQLSFVPQNVFRFSPQKPYDLIWSAGLFDYFNDNLFKRLIKKLSAFLTPTGRMVIGNFSHANPSRGYMELFNWNLIHRSVNHLRELARDCGFSDDQIHIDQEPEGVNLFLILTNA